MFIKIGLRNFSNINVWKCLNGNTVGPQCVTHRGKCQIFKNFSEWDQEYVFHQGYNQIYRGWYENSAGWTEKLYWIKIYILAWPKNTEIDVTFQYQKTLWRGPNVRTIRWMVGLKKKFIKSWYISLDLVV